MKKIFLIGLKDLRLAFRDRAALLMMLVAPFALTLGMGLVSGRFSGTANSGISDIPLVLVNEDSGELGQALVDLFQSADLVELVEAQLSEDAAEARSLVDADQFAAAIIIPKGFTASIIPAAGGTPSKSTVQIEFYANPNAPNSSGILHTILDGFLSQVEIGRVGGEVAVKQLVTHGLITAQDAAITGEQIGRQQAETDNAGALRLSSVTGEGADVEFDVLAFMAPGMALLFLMYTVSNGGRVLLAERRIGTLPRLLVSPTSTLQVFGGKVLGIYLTGLAQMLILIGGSTLLFQLDWGDWRGVLVLVMATVAGAVGWGMLITAFARTPGQVAGAGSAIMLLFGILGGSFINLQNMPPWFSLLSKITPNAWGLDGFSILALGGSLKDIFEPVSALLVMGVVLFVAAVVIINRRGFNPA